jgi:hypothetical protein
VPGEYRCSLATIDTRFHCTEVGEIGPMQRRLEEVVGDASLQCLVVGHWAECSQHLHNRVQGLAEGRALHQARTTGVPTTPGALAPWPPSLAATGASSAAPSSGPLSPVSWPGWIPGTGAQEAAARRQATVREEERDRMEAVAYYQAYVRGGGGARRRRLPG